MFIPTGAFANRTPFPENLELILMVDAKHHYTLIRAWERLRTGFLSPSLSARKEALVYAYVNPDGTVPKTKEGVVLKQPKISLIAVLFGAFFWLLPSLGEAATKTVDCNRPGATLQAAIDKLHPEDTLQVINGSTCNENVVVNESLDGSTLDGLGSATIHGQNTGRSTVIVRARRFVITGFTISGGPQGIEVDRGGSAVISANTIQNTGIGIAVHEASSARITNNIIQNNLGFGIVVLESSSARIGFFGFVSLPPVPGGVGPNTIQNNGLHGILVFGSSNAEIISNTIKNNGGIGVAVTNASHAHVSGNTIDGNAGAGILVVQNSGVTLGFDTGADPRALPNSTTVDQENGGFGITCSVNSSADGRLGTLNGNAGARNCTGEGSIDSLLPAP